MSEISRKLAVFIIAVAIVCWSAGFYTSTNMITPITITQSVPVTILSTIISRETIERTLTIHTALPHTITLYHTTTLEMPKEVVRTVTEFTTTLIPTTLPITVTETITKYRTVTTTETITTTTVIVRSIETPPHTIEVGNRLFEFYLPWNDSIPSSIDLSSYLHKPAGKYGHVYVGSDGRLYVGNQRIRFLGVSLAGSAIFMDKQFADVIAARLAKFGVNLVRLHALDAHWDPGWNIFQPQTTELRSETLDRMDYLVAKLKENGIYININLLCYRRFSSSDGLPKEIDNISDVKDQHVLVYFYEPIKDLVKDFAKKLLTHVNPYTGLSYAEDPAVAFIEVINEHGLIHSWIEGRISKLPQIFQDDLKRQWNEYLVAKYGSIDNAVKSWPSNPYMSTIVKDGEAQLLLNLDLFRRLPLAIRIDWIDFLWTLEEKFYREMYDLLKNELKVKAIVIGGHSNNGLLNIFSQQDAVDYHGYWQYMVTVGGRWYVNNLPMVNYPSTSTIVGAAGKRVYGKPFTISEYNHPSTIMFSPEGWPMIAAYAALQDWDAIVFYSYGPAYRTAWDARMFRANLDFDQHPAKMALLLTAHMLFLRGDVEPARNLVLVELPTDYEKQLVATLSVGAWNMPSAYNVGLPWYAPLMHRVAVVTDFANLPIDSYIRPNQVVNPGNYIVSDTGQLVWDCRIANRCTLIVNTSKSIVLVGFIGGRRFEFGNIVIEVGDTILDGWGIIALHVIEGTSFTDAKRILVLAPGLTVNNGMQIESFDTREVIFTASTSVTKVEPFYGRITTRFQGNPPTLIECIEARITIKSINLVSTWILDNQGRRSDELKTYFTGQSTVFYIGPMYRTIWYEITIG
ncbi:MAG: hypothetical protein QXL19_10810 [Ignisphaera sp.]